MKWVKYAMAVLGIVAAVIALIHGVLGFGKQGIFVLALALLPPILVGVGDGIKRPFGRLFASLSLLSFGILAMKTTKDPFQDVMMAAVGGFLLGVVLLIRPEKRKK